MPHNTKEYFFNPLVKLYFMYRLMNVFTLVFFSYYFLLAMTKKTLPVSVWFFFLTLLLLVVFSVIIHQSYLKEQLHAMELFDQLQEKLKKEVIFCSKESYHIVDWEKVPQVSMSRADMPYFYTHLPVHPLLRQAIRKEKRKEQQQLTALRLEIRLHSGEKIEIEGWFEIQETNEMPYLEVTKVANELEAYFGQEWVLPCVFLPTKKE